MEFSWLGGGVNSSGSVIDGTTAVISGSAGAAMLIASNFRVASTKAGTLWVETPMTFTWEGSGVLTGMTVASIDRDVWYFTPGLRYKTPSFKRFSLYGIAGGGTGAFSKVDNVVSGANGTVIVNSSVQLHPVFEFAAGVDLRLARWMSLRFEGRDFFSARDLGGVSGHNHPVVLGGIAIHL